jgi:hypothetical protein
MLLRSIKELLGVGIVKVLRRKPGSVRLQLELPPEHLEALLRLVHSGALSEHGVVGMASVYPGEKARRLNKQRKRKGVERISESTYPPGEPHLPLDLTSEYLLGHDTRNGRDQG